MKAASSPVVYITASVAALLVAASSFSAEYAKHTHGREFPFGMLIAASLLALAYWLIVVFSFSFRFSKLFLCWSRLGRLVGNACLALISVLAMALAFVPMALIIKFARLAASVPQVLLVTEQYLYELSRGSVGVTGLLLLIPLLLVALLIESRLVNQRACGQNAP